MTRKLTALLLAAVMLFGLLPVLAAAGDAPLVTAASFDGRGNFAIEDFTGTYKGETFTGVKAISHDYQPAFYFTADAVSAIKAAAAESGKGMLRIHVYAICGEQLLNVNNRFWTANEWAQVDVLTDGLTKDFRFWSNSEGESEIYLWFELLEAPLLCADSFIGDGFTFEAFTGTAGGEAVANGVKAKSSAYQPTFTLNETGLANINAYAAKNGVDTLRLHASYQGTNSLVINNSCWVGSDKNGSVDIPISALKAGFTFWSQSESTTEVILWAEAYKCPLVNSASFNGSAFAFSNIIGETVYGVSFEGVKAVSSIYQPSFSLTDDAVAAIKAAAEAAGMDALRINVYANLTNNGFIVNGTWCGSDWKVVDIPLESLSTSTQFWSQSEGTTEIYMSFELIKLPVISAASFTGAGCGFSNNDDGSVSVESNAYQPHFYFTADAVADIKAYAEENGYDTMKITATYSGTNCLVLNNKVWVDANPASLEVSIADLTADFDFWSQSESITKATLSFTFFKMPLINASSFTSPMAMRFTNVFDCTVEGETFDGVKVVSGEYQPSFYFTAEAIEAIKEYAEKIESETLTITAFAYVNNNALVINNQCWVANKWETVDVAVADLTTDFTFFCANEGATEAYLVFDLLAGHEHNFISGETVTPTCTEDGYTVYTCTCGETENRNIVPALGHDCVADKENSKAATCTEPGVNAVKCTRCDYTSSENVPALGHSYENGICIRCHAEDPDAKDPCEGYTDIDRSAWYHGAADYMIARGLMGSTSSGLTFEPETNVSRAMVAAVLRRIVGDTEPVEFTGAFKDVREKDWFAQDVEWCAKNGLAYGDNGYFHPDDNVTRQELAAFIYRLTEYLGGDVSGRADFSGFADAKSVESWATDYIAWAIDAGLIKGSGSGSKMVISPKNNATRAEFATMIMRFLQSMDK